MLHGFKKVYGWPAIVAVDMLLNAVLVMGLNPSPAGLGWFAFGALTLTFIGGLWFAYNVGKMHGSSGARKEWDKSFSVHRNPEETSP